MITEDGTLSQIQAYKPLDFTRSTEGTRTAVGFPSGLIFLAFYHITCFVHNINERSTALIIC